MGCKQIQQACSSPLCIPQLRVVHSIYAQQVEEPSRLPPGRRAQVVCLCATWQVFMMLMILGQNHVLNHTRRQNLVMIS